METLEKTAGQGVEAGLEQDFRIFVAEIGEILVTLKNRFIDGLPDLVEYDELEKTLDLLQSLNNLNIDDPESVRLVSTSTGLISNFLDSLNSQKDNLITDDVANLRTLANMVDMLADGNRHLIYDLKNSNYSETQKLVSELEKLSESIKNCKTTLAIRANMVEEQWNANSV